MAVVTTSTNGNKPKLDSALNESARLRLLKDKCFEGQNSYGMYYLYSVEHDGIEKIIFLTTPIHNAIVEAKLATGDEFFNSFAILLLADCQDGPCVSHVIYDSKCHGSPATGLVKLQPA